MQHVVLPTEIRDHVCPTLQYEQSFIDITQCWVILRIFQTANIRTWFYERIAALLGCRKTACKLWFLFVSESYFTTKTVNKQAFIDIRLRPGIATPFMAVTARCSLHVSVLRPLRPNVTSTIKPEVHKVAQRRRRRPSHDHRESAHKISRRSV